MKFDILEAIRKVEEHFGSAGDIAVSTTPYGRAITIGTIHKGNLLRKRFLLSPRDLTHPDVDKIIDRQLNRAINELELAIKHNDTNLEENRNAF